MLGGDRLNGGKLADGGAAPSRSVFWACCSCWWFVSLCWEACSCLAHQVETLTACTWAHVASPMSLGSMCGTVGTGLDLVTHRLCREPVLSAGLEAASGLCGAERGPGFPNFL